MRRIVITTLALIIAFSVAAGPEAEAAQRRGYRAQRSGGFFAGIMEVERRKNAWLRSTFLGN